MCQTFAGAVWQPQRNSLGHLKTHSVSAGKWSLHLCGHPGLQGSSKDRSGPPYRLADPLLGPAQCCGRAERSSGCEVRYFY